MPPRSRPLLAVLCALALGPLVLAGCAETTRYDAAGDVHAFLVSIRNGDKAAFDAHVDRAALKAQIRARLMADAVKRQDGAGGVAALSLLLGRPLVDALADQLIQPDVFRAVADHLGYSAQTPIPGRLAITTALRPVADGEVCVVRGKSEPCMLTFRNEDGVWRLIGFDGQMSMLKGPKRPVGG